MVDDETYEGKVGSQEAIMLVVDVAEGRRDVRQVAETLRNWG